MATTRITYTDGTSELVPITMRATCKAEAHAIEAGWGPITQSPVRSGAYAAYAALRLPLCPPPLPLIKLASSIAAETLYGPLPHA